MRFFPAHCRSGWIHELEATSSPMLGQDPHTPTLLDQLPPHRSTAIRYMSAIIRDAFPRVETLERNGLLTFHFEGASFGIGVNKNHIVVHVAPSELLHHFRADLLRYDHGKHCTLANARPWSLSATAAQVPAPVRTD